MTLAGVDCSHPISGAALAGAGKSFVFRYLSIYGGPKVLTASEAADHHAHGVGDGIVYEDNTSDLTSGSAHAEALADNAVRFAQALGIPAGVALFMTCDNNGASQPGVVSSMGSAASIIRRADYLAGFYGPKGPARQMLSGKTIDAAWVVDTWGADQPGDRWNFRQLPNAGYETVGGVECDQDDAPYPVGLWLAAAPAAPAPVYTPIQGDPDVAQRVTVSIPTGAQGEGYADADVDPNKVVSQLMVGLDPAKAHVYEHSDALSYTGVNGKTRVILSGSNILHGTVTTFLWVAA